MKIKVLQVLISIVRIILNLIYGLMKVRKTKNKIVFVSRQSDDKSLDFKLLEEELRKNEKDIEIKFFCKKLGKGFIKKISYCIYILRVMNNLANAKICITDGYSIPVSLLKHKKSLTIIQIWHASGATKKFGYQAIDTKEGSNAKVAKIMRMHYNYDYVLAPSKRTAEIFAAAFNVSKDKMKIIGLPRIDYLRKNANKLKEDFYSEHPAYKNKEIILYVPTFRKGKTADANELIRKTNKDKYGLIIRKHPLDSEKIEPEYLVDSKYDTMDLLKIADFIITDYSAIAYEASVLNKPLYFYVYDIDEYKNNRGLNVNLAKEMKEATFKKIDSIIKSIENDRYNYSDLDNFKKKYVEVYNKDNVKELINLITENIN